MGGCGACRHQGLVVRWWMSTGRVQSKRFFISKRRFTPDEHLNYPIPSSLEHNNWTLIVLRCFCKAHLCLPPAFGLRPWTPQQAWTKHTYRTEPSLITLQPFPEPGCSPPTPELPTHRDSAPEPHWFSSLCKQTQLQEGGCQGGSGCGVRTPSAGCSGCIQAPMGGMLCASAPSLQHCKRLLRHCH